MNFNLNDMFQALNHLTVNMAGSKIVKTNTVDHSYITPTIIALGDFTDGKVNELLQLTQGEPTMIWNLGTKPLSNVVKNAFQNQVIDAHWKTPCQYTRAPLLETVFSLCQSIKSWYDLNERNLTIIHCPTGQPSTGIVIACLLKYIGAFEHAAHAYDFYCSKRLKGDPAHTLAPSYRNLFTNVDKIVDCDGYQNPDPRFLKTITIAGLPLEEIPCVEVWDINGIIFSSHNGWNPDSSCTWNADYGDGFFKVSKFILGDFSVICRFGGNLANTKDKSTLIFKYQNTTAFLSEEILELKTPDVDVNPQYCDSLDVEIFTVHLMFETNPSLTPKQKIKDNEIIKLPTFPKIGVEAFEAGLDEISKLHSVVPDPKKCVDLADGYGVDEKYIAVALQLGNNGSSNAMELITFMQNRIKELQEIVSLRNSVVPSPVAEISSDESSWEMIDVGCSICKEDNPTKIDQIITCSNCPRQYHTFCAGLRKIPPFGTKSEQDIIIREKYLKRHFGDWKCARCCAQASKQEPSDQITTSHDDLSGSLKNSSLPNTMSSTPLVTSGGGVIITDKLSASIAADGPESATKNHVQSSSKLSAHPMSPNFRSKQDQVAILVAMLSSAGVSIEELVTMEEEKQRETVLCVMSKKFPEFSFDGFKDQKGNLDLVTAMKGILAHSKNSNESKGNAVNELAFKTPTQNLSSGESERKQHGLYKSENLESTSALATSSNLQGSSTQHGRQNEILNPSEIVGNGTESSSKLSEKSEKKLDPRAAMLENLKRRQLGANAKMEREMEISNDPKLSKGPANLPPTSHTLPNTLTFAKGNVDAMKLKDIPELSSYFTMLKAGANKSSVVEKIVSQGVVDSPEMANALLNLDPEKPLPPDFKQKFNILVSIATHPKYEKFYKMLKVGISKDIVKAKMADNGADPSMLDKDPDTSIPLQQSMGPLPGLQLSSKSEDNVFVSLEEQQKYLKYFKMQQMGIPIAQVQKKMLDEGLDPNSLPQFRTGGQIPPIQAESTSGAIDKVPLSDHPKYAKYFKMLSLGLAKESVQAKMQLEGVDPSILEKDPKELLPLQDSLPSSSQETQKIAIKDHPKYAKFFQMLKVGVPPEIIKSKMKLEGANPDMLDKDPNEMVVKEDDVKKVPVSEHPVYAKFFKMLKVGLPAHVIKIKMEAEGADPSMIDKDPNELIPLEEEKPDVQKVPAAEHPLYAKFFKMLKIGIPLEVVKAKMVLENADPAVLDKDPAELIPLDDPNKPNTTASNKLKVQQQKQRKKKLHWKAIDASQVNENSLWASEEDLDIHFDEDEFNQLFVEQEDSKKSKAVEQKKSRRESVKKQKVVLIDMKRAQNGGIALARIRFSFEDLKRKISNMDDEGLTTDQLKSLVEYLPNPEENSALKNFKGDLETVGVAEKYMMVMLGFNSAEKRIQCMLYKQQFRPRYLECRTKITKIQNACDDVKMSARLKKVLKYILKVGNQLNDGEVHKGFTVDSLLKLQSAKAYDKKTTVLQYVITLISRNDEDCLKFPEELKHVSDASRLSFDTITTEKAALRHEFTTNLNIVEDIRNKDPESDTNSMLDFLTKADQQCSELERGFEKAKEKFSGVLIYFGEDPGMSSQDFFSTLFKFIQEFIAVRETVERARRLELKKQQQQQQQQQQQSTPKPSRRATTAIVPDNEHDFTTLKRSNSGEKSGPIISSSVRSYEDEEVKSANSKTPFEETAEPKENVADVGRPAFLADIASFGNKNRRRSNLV